MARRSKISRKTKETDISVKVDLDGSGVSDCKTGIPFFDHMLDQISKHSLIDITINAKGDIEIDGHHTVEDVGLTLGASFAEGLGDKGGITRYAQASVPMNEALVEASVDISGRPFLVFDSPPLTGKVGEFDVELAEEFFQALVNSAGITLHITVRRGSNMHHVIEAIFKAVARALGHAMRIDPRLNGAVPSTKEIL